MKRMAVGLIAGLLMGGTAMARDDLAPPPGHARPDPAKAQGAGSPEPQQYPPATQGTEGSGPKDSPAAQGIGGAGTQETPATEGAEGTGGSGSQETPATGGAGVAGQQPPSPDAEGVQGEQKQLSGRVIGSSQEGIYLESESGAAIPLRVTHATRIEGRRIPRGERIGPSLSGGFKAGDTVRATFDVRTHPDGKMENVAASIDKQ